jgi:hypothetical protein
MRGHPGDNDTIIPVFDCVFWDFPYQEDLAQLDLEGRDTEMSKLLSHAKEVIHSFPYVAYKGNLMWVHSELTIADRIVICETDDQFDILRLEGTAGNNYVISTDEVIEVLEEIDNDFGIEIIGAMYGGLEFLLKIRPNDEQGTDLEKKIIGICPDVLNDFRGVRNGRVAIAWD